MKCADSKCSEGDAVWPFKFNIKVEKNEASMYTVTVIINRGQTENKEKLGLHIHYDVIVPIKIFFFNKGEAAQSVSKTIKSVGKTTDKYTQYSVQVANFDKDFNATSVVVGLQNIGFEIEYDGTTPNRGRHIQQFDFFIKTVSFNENEKQAYIGFQRGMLQPSRWFAKAEKIDYTMTITSIALAASVQPNVNIVLNSYGTICADDVKTLFWCSQQGLPERTQDEVDIKVGAEKSFELIGSAYPTD